MAEVAKAEAEAMREQQRVLEKQLSQKTAKTVVADDNEEEENNKAKTDSVGETRKSGVDKPPKTQT